jgi:hypothetical protein
MYNQEAINANTQLLVSKFLIIDYCKLLIIKLLRIFYMIKYSQLMIACCLIFF